MNEDFEADGIADPTAMPAADPPAGALPARTSAATLARAGVLVAATYLVARILGYVRVLIIGTTFGAGADLDAFFAAFRIPDLIFQLVAAGAVASALVPLIAGLIATGAHVRAWRVVSTVANLMLVALVVLAVVAFVVAEPLVAAVTPGFDAAGLAKTVDLTRIMLVAPILLALGAVATSALNADRRFGAAAVAPILYNLAIIGGAVLLSGPLGVTGLAIGVVVGSFGHLVVQLPALARAGFRYVPRIDLSDEQARRALALMGPRVLGLGVTQITFVVMTSLASNLGAGAISAYTIAFALLQIPLGVIGIPLGIVIFPSLSREIAIGRTSNYVELLTRSLRILIFVMLPITALAMVLRLQIVELLLGYGRFDQASVQLTADTLLLFMLGLTAHSAIGVLARAFYARQDTRTPVAAAILAVVVNTSLGVLLVGRLGLPALGLAIATAAWIEALVLLWMLGRREAGFDLRAIASVTLHAVIGSAVAAVAALVVLQVASALLGPGSVVGVPVQPGKVVLLVEAALASIAGILAYGGVSIALRIPELPSIVGIMVDLVRRRGLP
ncbi:MAG TPA: murein biosynthesis integral membrane protein MurJ [Candidatus Limnocylindrales bacterium]|nr:murein biosynthesis integral membrane protein MurJ [Candidatus Limnocylindrales bacterium]